MSGSDGGFILLTSFSRSLDSRMSSVNGEWGFF